MKLKSVFILLLIICFFAGCAKDGKTFESWQEEMHYKIRNNKDEDIKDIGLKHRAWYEIFVYSFNDTNGDGIGDINGITEMLDYIKYMGFGGIWLTPVHPSTTYHKYDITDYYAIDKQYGTLEDFDRLISECGKRDIAVIMDMVINHTSSRHKWFGEAVTAVSTGELDNKYISYYNFAEEAGNGQWNAAANGWFYECQFWSEMPDLNLENKEVRRELEDVFRFWLDRGVSGFRLDAAKEYITGNTGKNIEILKWVNDTVKSIKPDAYLVGEVWDTTLGVYDYYSSGIDSFFNFSFAMAEGKLAKSLLLQNHTAASYIDSLIKTQQNIKEKNPHAVDAPFFTNHDTARASGFLRRDSNLIKTAWGMNLMQTGSAFVYYGEEIGMTGTGIDQNKRAPMLWSNSEEATGITSGPPGIERIEYEFAPVVEQIGDESSILEYIRKAVRLRNKYPEIAAGEIKADDTEYGDKICAIYKILGDSSVCLYYNLSKEEAVIDSDNPPKDWLSATGTEPVYSSGKLTLPPYSIIITD